MGKNTEDKCVVHTTFDREILRAMEPLVGYYDKPFRTRGELIRYGTEQVLNEYYASEKDGPMFKEGESFVDSEGYRVTIDADGYAIRHGKE